MDVTQILAAFAAGGDQLAEAKAALAKATPAELAAYKAEVLKSAAKYSEKAGELTAVELADAKAHVGAMRAFAEQETALAALAAEGKATLAALAELGTEAQGTESTEAEATETTETTETEATETTEGTEGAGVQAAGRRLGGRQSGLRPAAAESATVQTVLLTGQNREGNTNLVDRRGIAETFSEAFRRAGNSPSGYGRIDVMRRRTVFPESRVFSSGGDALDNRIKLESLTERAATAETLTAAGGFCAPLQVLYDIPVVGDVDRPVRDALNRVTADRGGIQYRPAVSGVAQTGGIGVWTAADDVASPIVPKSCVEIDCPGVVEAEVEAIYQCLTISNMSARFDPEWADSIVKAQDIAYARKAENELITQLTTGSTTVQSKQLLGAVRDSLATIDHVVAYYRNVHRLTSNRNLRFIAPAWLKDLLRVDLLRQMPGDGLLTLAATDAMIADWFSARNVAVTWHIDGIKPANIVSPALTIPNQFYTAMVAGQVIAPFPDVVSTLLFAEGDWLLMDAGTLDVGIIRDSTLVGENKYQTFSEGFEHTAFRGIESLHVAMALQPTGASAATVATETLAGVVVAAGSSGD